MLFRDINFYLDNAKVRKNLTNDSRLAEALGYQRNMISVLRRGHSCPSPEKMVEIADLAGVEKETALLDLCMWSSRGEAQKTFANILHKLTHVIALVCLFTAVTAANNPSHAACQVSNEMRGFISYGKFSRFLNSYGCIFHNLFAFLRVPV